MASGTESSGGGRRRPASERRLAANRRNALRSTGPRTPEGKRRSAANGVRHGGFARSPVLPGESPAAYVEHLADAAVRIMPRNTMEVALTNAYADVTWRLLRFAAGERHNAWLELRRRIATGKRLPVAETARALVGSTAAESRLAGRLIAIVRKADLVLLDRAMSGDGAPVWERTI